MAARKVRANTIITMPTKPAMEAFVLALADLTLKYEALLARLDGQGVADSGFAADPLTALKLKIVA